jgi:hypothetical protein
LAGREGGTDFASVPYPELAEDAAEMALDRAVREEESRRHLAVCLSLGDEHSDALLCRRKRAGRRRPAADAGELCTGALGPERSAGALENHETLLERRPSLAPPLRAALRRSEHEERACLAEWKLNRFVQLDGLAEGGECPIELTLLCGE